MLDWRFYRGHQQAFTYFVLCSVISRKHRSIRENEGNSSVLFGSGGNQERQKGHVDEQDDEFDPPFIMHF